MQDNNSPIVRISEITIHNVKNVESGHVVFDCGRKAARKHVEADVLGMYGPNSSGKTTFIDVLNILKGIISGAAMTIDHPKLVRVGAEYSDFEVVFDMEYPDKVRRRVVYATKMRVERTVSEDVEGSDSEDETYVRSSRGTSEYRLEFFDEVVKISGHIDGRIVPLKPVIDTSTVDIPFGPTARYKKYFDGQQDFKQLMRLRDIKEFQSRSFIFSKEFLDMLSESGAERDIVETLQDIKFYARRYLHIIKTTSTGMIGLDLGVPIFTRRGTILLNTKNVITLPVGIYSDLRDYIESINTVLPSLVPGLTLELREKSKTVDKSGRDAVEAFVYATRNGVTIPLRDESDGVRKIVSMLALMIDAYNEPRFTVAIDELDASLYEYLIGGLLHVFQDNGRGQLIFTSHNLRLLEVLDKRFLWFTTTNPQNKYIRLKNIGATNNLRRIYIRELENIAIGSELSQDEQIADPIDEMKITEAFEKAGQRLS